METPRCRGSGVSLWLLDGVGVPSFLPSSSRAIHSSGRTPRETSAKNFWLFYPRRVGPIPHLERSHKLEHNRSIFQTMTLPLVVISTTSLSPLGQSPQDENGKYNCQHHLSEYYYDWEFSHMELVDSSRPSSIE